MPLLARWYIKTALVYLVAALLVGAVLAAGPLFGRVGAVGALWMTYLHLFVVGWLTQLIIGVAIWLFPRLSRERPHGDVRLVWAAYGLLNSGLLLRVPAEPGMVLSGQVYWQWALAASALLQWLSVVLFVIYIWGRVRTK